MGYPNNGWFIWENPMKMDDDWGQPYDSGNHHICMASSPRQIRIGEHFCVMAEFQRQWSFGECDMWGYLRWDFNNLLTPVNLLDCLNFSGRLAPTRDISGKMNHGAMEFWVQLGFHSQIPRSPVLNGTWHHGLTYPSS